MIALQHSNVAQILPTCCPNRPLRVMKAMRGPRISVRASTAVASTTSMTRQDLNHLGSQTSYVQSVPQQLTSTFDVALVIDDVALPAHTYVLVACSPFFADKIAAQDSDQNFHPSGGGIGPGQGLSRLSTNSYVITLTSTGQDEVHKVQAALGYLYKAYLPSTELPEIGSQEEAELLAQFSSKYDVQFMLGASDRFLSFLVYKQTSQVSFDTCPHCSNNKRLSEAYTKRVLDAAPEVIRMAEFADANCLPLTLKNCVRWLASFLRAYPEVYPELLQLKKDTLILILCAIDWKH